jgi:hypothetical protein
MQDSPSELITLYCRQLLACDNPRRNLHSRLETKRNTFPAHSPQKESWKITRENSRNVGLQSSRLTRCILQHKHKHTSFILICRLIKICSNLQIILLNHQDNARQRKIQNFLHVASCILVTATDVSKALSLRASVTKRQSIRCNIPKV